MKIFTSYYSDTRIPKVDSFFKTELIPFWKDYHRKLGLEPILISNIFINGITDDVLPYVLPEKVTPVSYQIFAWKYISSKINTDECALYFDPDAFILDVGSLNYVSTLSDFALTKKRNSFGESDAGIAVIKNTENFNNFIHDCINISTDDITRCHIEYIFDLQKRKNFISWNNFPILLRNSMCGFGNKISAVHGEFDREWEHIIGKDIKDILEKKEKVRFSNGIY